MSVTAGSTCAWSATSNAAWLTVSAGATGTGNGTVNVAVAANTGAQRSGTMTIAGQTFTVTQAAPCTYAIAPTTRTSPAAGEATSVSVTAGSTCAWSATSNAAWLTVSSGATGTGNGTVNVAVAANTGAQRSGTMTIAGQTFTVTQAAPCTYAIAPTTRTSPAAGEATSVSVTAGSTCAWSATSNAAWLTVSAGATGTGNGSVNVAVAANTGAQRSGTMTIAGQTFTVTQAAPCTYAIAPTTRTSPAAGEATSVSVTAGSTCAWSATSNAAWLTVSAGATGTGNGTVNVAVAANTGAQRSGTMTIAGQTFTVTQARPAPMRSRRPRALRRRPVKRRA